MNNKSKMKKKEKKEYGVVEIMRKGTRLLYSGIEQPPFREDESLIGIFYTRREFLPAWAVTYDLTNKKKYKEIYSQCFIKDPETLKQVCIAGLELFVVKTKELENCKGHFLVPLYEIKEELDKLKNRPHRKLN